MTEPVFVRGNDIIDRLAADPITQVPGNPEQATGVGMLTMDDVADLLGLSYRTLKQYRSDGRHGRRYADHPFPEPALKLGNKPIWEETQIADIKNWDATRLGQGYRTDRSISAL